MYARPFVSYIFEPLARLIKIGVPPTPAKARTGELTPPGIWRLALVNNSSLVVMMVIFYVVMDWLF